MAVKVLNTLESGLLSGKLAYAKNIYDETQEKFQSDINADNKDKIATNTADITSAKSDITTLQNKVTSIEGNIPSVPITGVKTDDKILAVGTDKKLSSTLTISYEQKSGDTAKKIYLNGINGQTISSIEATDFVKDGMLESASLVTEDGKKYLVLSFNTISGKSDIKLDVSELVDVYDGSSLKLSTTYKAGAGETPQAGKSVDAVVANLDNRITTAKSTADNALTEAKKANDAITNANISGLQSAILKAQSDATEAKTAASAAQITADSAVKNVVSGTKTGFVKIGATVSTEKTATVTAEVVTKTPVEYLGEAEASRTDALATVKGVVDYVTAGYGTAQQVSQNTQDIAALKTSVTANTNAITAINNKTYVNSIGGATGAITLDTTATGAGNIKFKIDGQKISATTDLSAYATTASVATKKVSEATSTSDGYAKAFDVKGYVDDALTEYATKPVVSSLTEKVNKKQDTLVSGTNIKTIGGTSLLGSGNIDMSLIKVEEIAGKEYSAWDDIVNPK